MGRPQAPRGARSGFVTSPSDPEHPLAFPGDGEGHFYERRVCSPDAYSAALATAVFSFSSKASIRRAVACGDFVNLARRL